MSEKRHKGMCFFYDKKFVPCHKCNSSKQLHLSEVQENNEPVVEQAPDDQEVEEVEEVEQEHEEACEILVHALNGITRFHTIRVTEYYEKKP